MISEMQIKMEKVLTDLAALLEDSEESTWASQSPKELLQIVAENLASIQSSGFLSSPKSMATMFLPTASLQDIAIDNSWGKQYLELANQFELVFQETY